jgi:hypothetical protein
MRNALSHQSGIHPSGEQSVQPRHLTASPVTTTTQAQPVCHGCFSQYEGRALMCYVVRCTDMTKYPTIGCQRDGRDM